MQLRDQFGGSFENRNRFLHEVIKEARGFYNDIINLIFFSILFLMRLISD